MDRKDFQLLVALHQDARQSYHSLGRRVSLSPPAVRERVKRLEKRGILRGYMLSVDPGLFGRDELLVFFQGDHTRQEAVRVLAVPEVTWVAWKLDGGLTVQVWPHDSSKAIDNLIGALGEQPSGHALSERVTHAPLSLLDWEIVDALVADPRMPFKKLVSLTNLSPKTVRRHLEMMLLEEKLFITPLLGALADAGELVYTAAVFGSVGMGELKRVMGDVFAVNKTQSPPARYLLCLGSDLGDVTVKTHSVKTLQGVESVTVTLNREMLVGTAFLRSLIRERIQELKKR